jgi:serine/threonine protein kinase
VPGQKLGRGSFGTVFRGRHATLGTQVVLKEYSGPSVTPDQTQAAARLCYAVGRQAQLIHPSIVSIYDLDLSRDCPVAAMEMCEGGSLGDRWRAGALRQPAALVLRAFVQILDGLAAAHEAGIVHGDIKPENVLFDGFGNGKLTDFGIDALREPDRPRDASAVSCLPPDLRGQGGQSTDLSADVYGVGVLLHQALTGRAPSLDTPALSSLVSGLSPALDPVLERMTADDPNERFQTAGEALKEYLRALPEGYGRDLGKVTLLTRQAPAAPASIAPARRT